MLEKLYCTTNTEIKLKMHTGMDNSVIIIPSGLGESKFVEYVLVIELLLN